MIVIIGVRFKKAGKIYYFDPKGIQYAQGDHVLVETIRGIEYGEVVFVNKEIGEEEKISHVRPVIRKATAEDDEVYYKNKSREKEAFFICKTKIINHNLNMKLIDVEYTFDNSKLLFYFTSDERVDFRELVKELASIFRTRIELRQIGVRDETKLCGGIGICGRGLCCHTFLNDFHTVSIKMAKDQDLSLNPIKISGICGRLMCCLQYENESYTQIRDRLPEVSEIVLTPEGKGEVLSVNILREQVRVAVKQKDKDTKEAFVFSCDDIKLINRTHRCMKEIQATDNKHEAAGSVNQDTKSKPHNKDNVKHKKSAKKKYKSNKGKKKQ
ncbi:MAG: stage 0 sporulation protein [Epulopiscium sp. Nuni2H_MBin003]|nr:MAG: stage 0 sporulation protein [Epulopiscium sp. Nuni2H_MBin003]